MSAWFNDVVNDISNIVNCIAYYEDELRAARKECKIAGSVEHAAGNLPGVTEHRFTQLQEIEAILEHLNITLKQKRSKVFKKFLEAYNRALSSRDAEKYVDGDDDIVDFSQIVNQFALLRNKYLAVLKGLEIKGYQINNIVRLRCAGLEDIRI